MHSHPRSANVPSADEQLRLLSSLPVCDPAHSRLRSQVIEAQLPMARRLASRFRGKGEPLEDLYQSAYTALIKAVDRFDPGCGVPFAAFAIPCITGGLKCHFRDHTWTMRVPRSTQELVHSLSGAADELTQRLKREPTTAELAVHVGVAPAAVLAGRRAVHAYRPVSLDVPDADGSRRGLMEVLGGDDPGFAAVDERLRLVPALGALPDRERRILAMYFYRGMTQAQIGAAIGISQMQISRLLSKALGRLRATMAD